MNNHVILITGLGSSIPVIGEIWRKWAKTLRGRVKSIDPDCVVTIVSSDGMCEEKAFEQIMKAKREKTLGRLVICGHSNGFRDGLRVATELNKHGVIVDYFAGIDMTLGEFGAKASPNIAKFDEFHATLNYANFSNNFDRKRHTLFEIRKSHTAAASDQSVQDRIARQISLTFRLT